MAGLFSYYFERISKICFRTNKRVFCSYILTLAADLSEKFPFIVEDFDAVGPVVRDEDFLAVVHDHSVGELQVFGAPKLAENCAHLVEDDDAHDLALYHDNEALGVYADAAGMLEDVSTELTDELTVLIVDLNLKIETSLVT